LGAPEPLNWHPVRPKQGFFPGGQKKAGEGSRLFWRWQPGPAAAAKKGRGRVSTLHIGDVGVGGRKNLMEVCHLGVLMLEEEEEKDKVASR
jgi:hypothetical protein